MYITQPTSQQVKLQHKLQLLGRQHRKQPTSAEYRLWYFLRGKRLGYQFRRQFPIFRFIVDYYCSVAKLVIEVDGPIHNAHRDYDHARDQWLSSHGYTVLRFTNNQVMQQTSDVIRRIQIALPPLQEEVPRRGGGVNETDLETCLDFMYTPSMRLPTSQEIMALYQQYHTPPHIQDHMRVVAAVAKEIGSYHQANLPLVEAAALLHDLVRVPEQWPYLPTTISTPQAHAQINFLLLQENFPEVAEVIRMHSLMTILADQPFSSLEAKLIYYADKRADNSTVVTLKQRLEFGQERWHIQPEQDRRSDLLPKLIALEQELFRPLPYEPTELKTKTAPAH